MLIMHYKSARKNYRLQINNVVCAFYKRLIDARHERRGEKCLMLGRVDTHYADDVEDTLTCELISRFIHA